MSVDIKVENLSVVFGSPKQQEEALRLIDEGLSAEEIKKKTGATVANKNVNFKINKNELFVIVGLSGNDKSMEAIETVGLKGWEYSMINELSGGMRQRVGLARALTNDPKLLLMDEPYSALDPLIRRDMQNELLSLEDQGDDRTIVFITHDMNEAFRMGDRIALMKNGEVVQIGTFNDFSKHPANDYVRDFIADVDRSRILKVRSIMRKVKHSLSPSATIDEALAFMEEKEIDSIYITDDKNQLLGIVLKEDLEKTRNKTVKALIKTENYQPVLRNSYIKDVLKDLKESDHDIPVTDSKGRLRGVLGYDDVIDALAE